MQDVKWIKIYTNMVSNKKIKRIRALPEGNNIVLIWVFLLAQAGECNKGGALYLTDTIPFRAEDLAIEFDFEVTIIQLALMTLERFSMIEVFEDIIYIKNWDKYQNIKGLEIIREQTRLRNIVYREKNRQKRIRDASHDATNDAQKTQDDAIELRTKNQEQEKNTPQPPKGNDGRFDVFWNAYPKKVARETAKKAFGKVRPDGELMDIILSRLEAYKHTPQWLKDGGQYIPNPATWLNQKRWEDEIEQDNEEPEKVTFL